MERGPAGKDPREDPGSRSRGLRVSWEEIPALWEEGLEEGGWRALGNGRFRNEGSGRLLELPRICWSKEGGARLDPGSVLFFLMRAGAVALGIWRRGEWRCHRADSRYVVRGRGKAQPSYLAAKGTSRYGSRLRLRNHRRLLEETAACVRAWAEDPGFSQVLYAVPVRLWAEIEPEIREVLPRDRAWVRKLGLHVHRPLFAELERIAKVSVRGRLFEGTDPDSEAP